MKFYLRYLLILVSNISATGCLNVDTNKEQLAVGNCFQGYRMALLEMDGESAYSYLNNRSRKGYEHILTMCKEYDSLHLDKEKAAEKFYVLTTRQMSGTDTLMNMTGKTFFIASVVTNVMNTANLSKMQPEVISVQGNDAKMSVITGKGKLMEGAFFFKKENNKWRIDILKTLDQLSSNIEQVAKESGKTENEVIYELAEAATGDAITPDAWIPANRKVAEKPFNVSDVDELYYGDAKP